MSSSAELAIVGLLPTLLDVMENDRPFKMRTDEDEEELRREVGCLLVDRDLRYDYIEELTEARGNLEDPTFSVIHLVPLPKRILQSGLAKGVKDELSLKRVIALAIEPGILDEVAGFLAECGERKAWYRELLKQHFENDDEEN